jgi:hypothetical protein
MSYSTMGTPAHGLRAEIRYTERMRPAFAFMMIALLVAVGAAPAQATMGLSPERGGLGLRRPAAEPDPVATRVLRGEYTLAAPGVEGTAAPYGGLRYRTRLGVSARESFGGLTYHLSDRSAASVELGMMESTPLAPRRYSLSGQLQTAFDSGSGMSIGLSYRVYEPDYWTRPGGGLEMTQPNGYSPTYSLVPVRAPGTGMGPSYQLQLQYQYSSATTFGLVLGRELETFTAGFDSTGAALRQFSFTGQHWLTPSWALSYDVLSNDPGSLRLQGLRLGVRYRF